MPYYRVQAEFVIEADGAEAAEAIVDILCDTAAGSFTDGDIQYTGACAPPAECDPPDWAEEVGR